MNSVWCLLIVLMLCWFAESTADVEPLIDSYDSKPVSDSYDSKPVSDSYDSKPVSDSYDSKPVSDSYDSDSDSDSYGSEPDSDSYDSDVATIKRIISEIPNDHPLRHTFSQKHYPNFHRLTRWLEKQHPRWHHLPHRQIITIMGRWHYGQHNHWSSVQVHYRPVILHSRPVRPMYRPDLRPIRFQEWLVKWKSREARACGISDVESVLKMSRIMGGQTSRPGNWPWMVSLKSLITKQHMCAGTLISREWVVTSIHCFASYLFGNTALWEVRIGKFNISGDVTDRSEQNFKIAELFLHEAFRWRPVTTSLYPGVLYNIPVHDVALIRLDHPAVITRWVKPLCLPDQNEINAGQKCVITGWGTTDKLGFPGVLNEAIVPVFASETCSKFPGYDKLVMRDNVCAGYKHGKVDTCEGDSGGPLQCIVKNKWVLTGTTSYGDGGGRNCSLPMRPGVYMQISKYVDWIHRHIYQHYLETSTWSTVLGPRH